MKPFDGTANAGIQGGTVTITLASASQGTSVVTFDTAYAATPKVIATVNANTFGYFAVVTAKSATGATIGISQRDGSSVSGSVTVDWVAFPIS